MSNRLTNFSLSKANTNAFKMNVQDEVSM